MTDEREEMTTNEELRLEWSSSVADANQAIDLLQEAKAGDDADYISQCESQLQACEEKADLAYQAYTKATASWVTDAPLRFTAVIVASTIQNAEGTEIVPALTFGFRAGSMGEPIIVTLANSEMELRRFQKELGKQIDKAIHKARELGRG